MRPGVQHVSDLRFRVAAGAQPGKPVMGERRPGADGNEDDHQSDGARDGAGRRTEHELGAAV
jgi:hypothetical protein